MIIEIGHYALVLALATAIILSVVPVIGARRGDQAMMDVAPLGSVLLFALVAFSFGVLTYAHGGEQDDVPNGGLVRHEHGVGRRERNCVFAISDGEVQRLIFDGADGDV